MMSNFNLFLVTIFILEAGANTGLVMDINPSQIQTGHSEVLDVNCSFSKHVTPDKATLISLVLSKAIDWDQNFTEIAAVTSFSPYKVKVLAAEEFKAAGLYDEREESYLHLQWTYPEVAQTGLYQCSAYMVDEIGRCIVRRVNGQVSASSPQIVVQPSEIALGLSDMLEINCSFAKDGSSNMAALISLVISKRNGSAQNFLEIAAVSSFSPHTVNMLTTENINAEGFLSQTGESYIHLTWDHPDEHQSGWYQCTAHEVDVTGHNIVMDSNVEVAVDESNLSDVIKVISEMKEEMAQTNNYVKNLEQHVSVLEQTVSEQYKNNSDILELTVSGLRNLLLMIAFESTPLMYINKIYYVSKRSDQNIKLAEATCNVLGGYLAEIDDSGEYKVIVDFLDSGSDFGAVAISGTDENSENSWILPRTGQTLPFTHWDLDEPGGGITKNCLMLKPHYWRMFDIECVSTTYKGYRFLCELPQKNKDRDRRLT